MQDGVNHPGGSEQDELEGIIEELEEADSIVKAMHI